MLKKIIKKIIYPHRYSSDAYIKTLQKMGMRIGKNTVFYSPLNTLIDETRPWLIDIGENVKITEGVTILTHGFDWSVIKVKYGDILGSSGKVKIGNNVFIGVHTIILKGVTIGNNVIIGAGSLINKDIPSDSVVAGVPAKFICSINDYYEKRIESQEKEATELAIEYFKSYKKWPIKEVLREFLFLFEPRDDRIKCNAIFNEIGFINDNYIETLNAFYKSKPLFKTYDDFINHCKMKIN